MRDIMLFVLAVMVGLSLRQGCESKTQAELARDCRAVCDDIGQEHDHAVKTGMFSYTCQCKKKKNEPVKIHRHR